MSRNQMDIKEEYLFIQLPTWNNWFNHIIYDNNSLLNISVLDGYLKIMYRLQKSIVASPKLSDL